MEGEKNMALNKEIIFKNGVVIKYHKINDVNWDNKNKSVKIEVVCYSDETYRQKEKENFINNKRYEEIMGLIMKENEKPETDRDVNNIILLSEEANNLVVIMNENLDLSVLKIDLEFENVTDLSMDNLYSLIKETEMFKDSIDLV